MRINKIMLGGFYTLADNPNAGIVRAVTIIGRLHRKNTFGTECVQCQVLPEGTEPIFVDPANMKPYEGKSNADS